MAVRIRAFSVILCVLTASSAAAEETRHILVAIPEPLVANAAGTSGPIEIMREAYRRAGVTMDMRVVPSERTVREANAGRVDADIIQPAAMEAAFPSLMPVPEPVISLDIVGITTGLDFPVAGWASLASHKTCVVRGMKEIEAGTEGMPRVIVNTLASALAMLQAGRCDLAVFAMPAWLDIDKLHMGSFHQLAPAVATISFYHYLNRRNADLAPKLAAALAGMRRDGTLAALTAVEDQAAAAARQHSLLPPPSD